MNKRNLFIASFVMPLCNVHYFNIAYVAGPAKIKRVKTCGNHDWNHSAWVIDLNNGSKLSGGFNPSQEGTATYSKILSAYIGVL